ncbi:MAG: THUMP domain-containing protein [Candidatus Alkanophagales archaeon]
MPGRKPRGRAREKDWNLLVVKRRECEEGELLRELEGKGEFEVCGEGVLFGRVDDVTDFLEDAEKLRCVGRAVPLESVFTISESGDLVGVVKKYVAKHIDEIEPEERLCVHVETRGEVKIPSRVVEREVTSYLQRLVEQVLGRKPKIDRRNPDKMFSIYIVGDKCGICFLTREMREKYKLTRP